MREISITSIEGLLVGHAENAQAKTGCTVILAPNGAAASCHNPGFAPGSRETDALKPANSIDTLHGLCLSGGSAFGLAAAGGVAKYLREKGLGVKTPHLTVPLVAAAVI
ncbi:MAG: P1 family peptidase, partial [Deltaproteobacteria bacterium]|nr:P1 family peptidase [Deltaproteobacteria bacterium]